MERFKQEDAYLDLLWSVLGQNLLEYFQKEIRKISKLAMTLTHEINPPKEQDIDPSLEISSHMNDCFFFLSWHTVCIINSAKKKQGVTTKRNEDRFMIQRRKYYLSKEKELKALRANKLRAMLWRPAERPDCAVKFPIFLKEKENDVR